MASTYENASDALERHRGLHLIDRPDKHPSRSSDVVYRVAAMVAALFLLVTIV